MDPTTNFNHKYISNLVQACKEDSFINSKGEPLNFIDRMSFLDTNAEYENLKTVCSRLKDNQRFGDLTFSDQLEVLSRIKAIYTNFKNLSPGKGKEILESINSIHTMMAAKLTLDTQKRTIKQELDHIASNLMEGYTENNSVKHTHALKKTLVLFDHILTKSPNFLEDFKKEWNHIYSDHQKRTDNEFSHLKNVHEHIQSKIKEKPQQLENVKTQQKGPPELYLESFIRLHANPDQKLENFQAYYGHLTPREQLEELINIKNDFISNASPYNVKEQMQIFELITALQSSLEGKISKAGNSH